MFEIIRTDGLCSRYTGEPLVIALGNFDGVHLGHAEILRRTVMLADELSAAPAVLSFDIHPQVAFGKGIKLITSEEDRYALFCRHGIKYAVHASFEAFKDMLSADFLSFLKSEMHCIGACCGYNFRFGKGGEGDSNDVRLSFGQNALICDRFTVNGQDVSSSEIRSMTECGRVKDAALLLGRPYSVSGTVTRGRQIGRKLDFPTANITIASHLLAPAVGIYATFTEIEGRLCPSVTNYGNNPTVTDKTDMILETHIIGFSEDIYGETVRIHFVDRIRDQKKFATLDELRTAIAHDRAEAERICNEYAKSEGGVILGSDYE